jgi:Na+-transporting NADH:ubiquinone oxidoreductase subunit F
MTYLVGITVFSGVVLILVTILLFIEAKVIKKGDCRILINNDEEKSVTVSSGSTLLASLVNNEIFLPSACGGGGSCGQCRCKVEKGGGDILPTELPHLSRKEKKEDIRLACQVKVREEMQIQIPPEIFSIQKFNASVVSNNSVATFIKELALSLDPEQDLKYEAGAYMQIDIPEYEVEFTKFDVADRFNAAWEKFELRKLEAHSEEAVYRAYSLASPPYEKDLLKFTIRLATPPADHPDVPPGVGSSYVFSLKAGDKVTLSGPYGDFFVGESDREMCFVGGGAGMAPMRCHILHQLNTVHTKRKVTFWYGARSKQEMFYDDEFQELDQKFDNFSYHVALSEAQPEDNWTGLNGFIHQCLFDSYLKGHQDPSEIEYYLCGPPMMLDAVMEMLDNQGVDPEMIAFDKF